MENDLLKEYLIRFNEYPPLIMEFPYECDEYQFLIDMAIMKDTPITEEMLADFIKKHHIEYGFVQEDFDPDEETDYE